MTSDSNIQYVLSLSYGKDSLACLEAIRLLGLPLDRIVHAEVWATDTIPADLPPMVEFKKKADKIIKERYGIEIEHICAMKNGEKLTYEKMFYTVPKRRGGKKERNYGFPQIRGNWCTNLKQRAILDSIRISTKKMPFCQSRLEASVLDQYIRIPNHPRDMVQRTTQKEGFPLAPLNGGAKINTVQYLGIAADEPKRIKRHSVPGKMLPLVMIGWDEAYCRKWCEENDLLSPIYTTSARGGCWFCHNQGIDQLRLLRRNYPELWALLLKWDDDSPVTFHPDGHTVHDFDIRFQAEDESKVPTNRKFRWKMLMEEEQ